LEKKIEELTTKRKDYEVVAGSIGNDAAGTSSDLPSSNGRRQDDSGMTAAALVSFELHS